QTVAVGGTKTTNDVLTLTIYDAGLSGGSQATSYTVQSGDSLSNIASGIASAINGNSNLQTAGITATPSGVLVTITSNSPNLTDYRQTYSSGATEILTLGIPQNGTQTAVIGGTKTTNDVLTIKVTDAGLSGGSKSVSYTVQSGDNINSIATGVASA